LTKEEKLRVLYCSENYSPHDHRFLTALAGSGHEIYWLRLEEGGRIQESRPLPKAIRPVQWRRDNKPIEWRDFGSLKIQFKAAVDRINPDLIHAGPIQRVAYLPALIDFHPFLAMSWGFDLLENERLDKTWEVITRFVLQHCDWFTSDCQTTKNIAVGLGISEPRSTVFPWGVDLDLFNPDNRESVRHQVGYEEDLLIIHTRSWESRYGVDIALEGFWRALQIEPDLRLLMLGGGSLESQVKLFVSEKGITDRVHFLGYQQNEALVRYYQAADVYLSASHIDGSSVALMESMACGCPALVSDIPANLEWIKDGDQGWVFKDGDSQSLAEKIINISRNKKELSVSGKNALKKAKAEANWSKNFAKLLETYDLMIKNGNR
jgi:L-malate glycosyltransferase